MLAIDRFVAGERAMLQKIRPETRHHLVFLIVWVLLAILSFSAANRLTHKVVDLSSKPVPTTVVGVYGAKRLTEPANVEYVNDSKDIFVRVYFPAGTTQIALSGAAGHHCSTSASGSSAFQEMPLVRKRILMSTYRYKGSTEIFDVSTVPGGLMECSDMHLGIAERFTTDVLRVYYPSPEYGLRNKALFGVPRMRFAANVQNAEHFQIVGSAGFGGTAQLEEGDDPTVRWDITTSESRRDVYLVVIGSLIAFGAALSLEAIRTLIEILVPSPK
jgi:hypothetical protein